VNEKLHPHISHGKIFGTYLQVFDYDWGFQDDFMGMAALSPRELGVNKATEIALTLTEHNEPGEESMGQIFLTVTLIPRSIEEKEIVS